MQQAALQKSPSCCAAAAVQRIGITWGSAILCDLAVLWPLALVMSRHVWKDGVATWPDGSEEPVQEQDGGVTPAVAHAVPEVGRSAGPPAAAVMEGEKGASAYSTPVKRSNSAGVGEEGGGATPSSASRREALNLQAGAWD